MRIVDIAAFHVRIPLRKTIRHASHARDATDSLLVRCRLSDGSVGWGEGLPRPYVTGESIDSAVQQFEATNLASQIGGEFDSLTDAISVADRIELDGAPSGARDCSSTERTTPRFSV